MQDATLSSKQSVKSLLRSFNINNKVLSLNLLWTINNPNHYSRVIGKITENPNSENQE